MFTNTLNPILLSLGPLTVRWYGLFLAIGVTLAILIITKLFKEKKYSVDLALDLGIWLTIGGLLGARLGEILFYEPAYYFSNPIEMIFINHGGLSSHGMTIGLILTLLLFSKIKSAQGGSALGGKISIKQYLDILIIPIPLLAAFIRIGNFFNSEIVGKPTNLPWGVKFPFYETIPVFRHPSQLYESLISLSLFISIYFIYKKYNRKLPPLFITNLFFLLYFSSRFLIEFLKADYQTSLGLTMGQILSVPFIVFSAFFLIRQQKN
ncbi:MAG: prolipoprotein diacylglyceryl transferase [Candidatus Magasanikbacteria bacterium]|nr:prolipoprotein diacylglyceryl transferase [Candidatus Magasanikbacteria bacterium]